MGKGDDISGVGKRDYFATLAMTGTVVVGTLRDKL